MNKFHKLIKHICNYLKNLAKTVTQGEVLKVIWSRNFGNINAVIAKKFLKSNISELCSIKWKCVSTLWTFLIFVSLPNTRKKYKMKLTWILLISPLSFSLLNKKCSERKFSKVTACSFIKVVATYSIILFRGNFKWMQFRKLVLWGGEDFKKISKGSNFQKRI